MKQAAARWDLFCRVVDNFGDIGIAWRLARQLEARGAAVRLFVDDFVSFARIEPRLDASRDAQELCGVAVARWPEDSYDPADVVVESLGCGLPDVVVATMARATDQPVWIDFEHLSAEAWVDGCHGLPSPHPALPLVKHFFYPGFGGGNGGLLIEPDYEARRRAFVDDPEGTRAARRRFGIGDHTRVASLFAYPGAPVRALLAALAEHGGWTVVVVAGVADDVVADWQAHGRSEPALVVLPFVDQDEYDRLLWTCDINVVRGEDSFVRAQAAGKPFVWHIYPQADDAHLAKLAAFEALYDGVLTKAASTAQRGFWRAWNAPDAGEIVNAARAWLDALPALHDAARRWQSALVARPPLVDRLRRFVGVRTSMEDGPPASALLK